MTQEEYLNRRSEFAKIRDDSFDSFDKTIIAISTGALALSLAYIEKIGRPFNGLTVTLIIVAWVGWTLVFVLNLLSYYYAKKNADKKIDDLDQKYAQSLKDHSEFIEKTFWTKKAVDRCNTWGLIMFIVAICCFFCYVFVVQCHNYSALSQEKKEVEVVVKDLDEGKIEVDVNGAKVTFYKAKGGKYEMPQAVTSKSVTMPKPVKISNGKTETSPPVTPKK